MKLSILLCLCALSAALYGCDKVTGLVSPPVNDFAVPAVPKEFPAVPFPADNPFTAAKAELGRHLFYDKRLSKDFSTSCGSCHQSQQGFADGSKFSHGFAGLMTTRNSMSLVNVAYNKSFFWDGGVVSLEVQALAPLTALNEMNMNTDSLVRRIENIEAYQPLFAAAWGDGTVSLDRITKSLATFERKLVSGQSSFDQWNRGNTSALSASAARGAELFFGEKGDCFHCHQGYNFTDNQFHSNALDSLPSDEGRYRITGTESDKGLFRTPTLRNTELTAPYMHDGRFTTLHDVVRHYNSGGKLHINRDVLMRPLGLSDSETDDLVAFLKSLTDTAFIGDTTLQSPWK